MPTRKIVEYLFFSLLSMIGTLGVSYTKEISKSLSKLTTNVVELNGRLELMAEKMVEASAIIKDHEARLRRIERTE